MLTANPIEVHLKQGRKGPYRQQYPLKQEAIEGVRETIEGLLKAGVLRRHKARTIHLYYPCVRQMGKSGDWSMTLGQ